MHWRFLSGNPSHTIAPANATPESRSALTAIADSTQLDAGIIWPIKVVDLDCDRG